ncbi:hypothetical protein [Arthrobacter sp. H14]|uniref:hypothetical protein n=1 Tax=Arthrobacter sp. H14 TaxID=1312959 RepID=UPI00047DFBB0|nr:hypothetical protein [Arthrobacter sp. H14]
MTEQKPEDDLTIVGDDETDIPDQNVDAVPPEIVESDENTVESEEVQPDSYPQAAENDPEHWQQDPLISGGAASDVTTDEAAEYDGGTADGVTEFGATSDTSLDNTTGSAEDELSDQTLRDETAEERYRTGDEQIAPEEPTIGEAAGDVDFGDALDEEEVDGSDDPANAGGRPLSRYNTGDPEQ